MTHMDDQVANHIKEMIRKITRKPTDSQEQPRKPGPLDQIVRILRSPPNDLYEIILPTRSVWRGEDPRT